MTTTPVQRAAQIAVLALLVGPVSAETLANPIGAPTGSNLFLGTNQFLAARFNISTPQTVTAVTAEFTNASGGFFAALVPLSSMTALPIGNPSLGVPFNAGEVFAYEVFQSNIASPTATVSVPFSVDVAPGVYGVILGTGLYGTSGFGSMPSYFRVQGSSSFFWSDSPWRWQDSSVPSPTQELNITLTVVPEPSAALMAALGVAFVFSVWRRSYRQS